ncbi:hypothetical protein GYMLUDRAFT_57997 [Collybiopsis luxurians FD-317 M1]|uniref:FAD/NAD(P)-binding domain-containing protein n=1 Tax=Collybiopsis luxurians FD-317 M1 TaxID=944289 RepID=A0A0D0CJ08_9AGAR|nr:hypothetical protein GYMLUDRAFT_57997 [Collybiopsis luxurians FD-317 M1]
MDTHGIASAWLTKLSSYLEQKDASGFTSLIHSHGWFRDLLVFTWNLRTLNGQGQISKYSSANIGSTTISDVQLCSDAYFKPGSGDQPGSVSSGFTFSTSVGNGRGLFTLTQVSSDSGSEWKAFNLLMALESLKGFEPIGAEQGVYHGQSFSWSEVRENRQRVTEEDLQALVVGGGQNGLQVAARFQQMGIPTLVVEKNARIGDQWRKRYPSLTLHSTKQYHTLLYQPYPQNWPRYTPRDKIADWLEQYAVSQDLFVWTKSHPLPTPSYDPKTKRWTISIDRDGQITVIHPKHIVLATGTLGEPYVPDIEGRDLFKGQAFHSEHFPGGSSFAGKRVVVVGTGNSAADIALDLHVRGAEEQTGARQLFRTNSQNSDWSSNRTFYGQRQAYTRRTGSCRDERNFGPGGAGLLPLAYEDLSGKSALFKLCIIHVERSLQDTIKSGTGIQKFSENALVLDDGSTLEADAIVFATGYVHRRSVTKKIFGDVIDKTGPVYNIDEAGETRGGYRPTGHPGLWYAPGDFEASRFGSRLLAIQLQALELGYMNL